MNFKRKRRRHARACGVCKPSKRWYKTADRMQARRTWRRDNGLN
jgi:hypothetical protein